MKKIIFILLFVNSTMAQEKLEFSKDTIFITFSRSFNDSLVKKEYHNIRTSNLNKSKHFYEGVKTTYILLDSILFNKKKRFSKIEDKAKKEGKLRGASSKCDGCFGIYFIHTESNFNYYKLQIEHLNSYFNGKTYKYIQKMNMSPKLQLYNFYKRLEIGVSSKLLYENEINKVKTFEFNGTTQNYKLLFELIKEPHYFFIQDRIINDEEVTRYLFKEVVWRNNFE